MDTEKVKLQIESCRKLANTLDQQLETLSKSLEGYEQNPDQLIDLIKSDAWPTAVDPDVICDSNSEQDKIERASSIFDLNPMNGKNILDFGCGEGHVVKQYSDQNKAIGFDIINAGNDIWTSGLATTSFEEIEKRKPYDFILMYDVIDHLENSVETLLKVKSLLSNDGFIFARCHPWSSRHGGHLYQQMNKAFLHFVLSPEDLKNKLNLNLVDFPKQMVHAPLMEYENMFKQSQLKIKETSTDTTSPEDFFNNNECVWASISEEWQKSPHKNKSWRTVKYQMSLNFVDYKLTL